MEFKIFANRYDWKQKELAEALQERLVIFSNRLSCDYGGIMEHLWLDLELGESSCLMFNKPAKAFRFQKKVSGASRTGLPAIPDRFNVGHYSVRPDFKVIRQNTSEQNITYIIELVYQSTEVLLVKQKKLGGFDATRFRHDFLEVCQNLDCLINTK